MTEAPVKQGDILAGKFRVEQVLGAGGMGVVVAATHLQLEQRVALKFLLPEAAKNPNIVQRFEREARAASRIKSQHVARVSDVGVMPDGAPYMVMEFLEGEDLAQRLARLGRLGLPEAVDHLLQACEALVEAHHAGIIHRDLKPANLFLARQPGGNAIVKVLDFGIAKLLGQVMTVANAAMGTFTYMAPEQWEDARDVDARADLWALGITLYELLTGETPYRAETVPELWHEVKLGPTPSVEGKVPYPAPPVDAILARCLAKKPADRYPDIASFCRALAPLGTRQAVRSMERIDTFSGVLEGAAAGGHPTSSAEHVIVPRNEGISHTVLGSRPRSGLALLLLLITIPAAVLGWAWSRRGGLASEAGSSAAVSPEARPPIASESTPAALLPPASAAPSASAPAPPQASTSAPAARRPAASRQPSAGGVSKGNPTPVPPHGPAQPALTHGDIQ
jgi:serine/threonine-protein kinase